MSTINTDCTLSILFKSEKSKRLIPRTKTSQMYHNFVIIVTRSESWEIEEKKEDQKNCRQVFFRAMLYFTTKL